MFQAFGNTERPNMKKTQLMKKATDPTGPNQEINFTDGKKNSLPDESFNLSPKRIEEGTATITALLNQILTDGQQLHHFSP